MYDSSTSTYAVQSITTNNVIYETNTDSQRHFLQHVPHDTATMLYESSMYQSIPRPNSLTNAQTLIFRPQRSRLLSRESSSHQSQEEPHINTTDTNVNIKGTQTDQARVKLTLGHCTRHILPGGLECDEPDQEDLSLCSDKPANFRPPPSRAPCVLHQSIQINCQTIFR